MNNEFKVNIEVATEVTSEILDLVTQAVDTTSTHRGGAAMIATILDGRELHDVLRDATARQGLFIARDNEALAGFALCRDAVIEAIFVPTRMRRHDIATTLVGAVTVAFGQGLDAYALPGDRGTKSLYESLGWKARLLTMRAE